jgi:probable DNA metabolism protein
MHKIILEHEVDFAGWRAGARRLLQAGIRPPEALWLVRGMDDLFATLPEPLPPGEHSVCTSPALLGMLERLVQAHDPERFALAYRLLWRFNHGEKHLLALATDADMGRAELLCRAVRRDRHKMRAFVRFREVPVEAGFHYVAWFEPAHFTLEGNARFFSERFATMRWSILTPYRSMHWDGETVSFSDGANRDDLPADDRMGDFWNTYYRSIFNPARLKLSAMAKEMPKKYWKNLPEAAAIAELTRQAGNRTDKMLMEGTQIVNRH